MIVGQDIKLDYDDVLIVPQRTRTASRKEIDVQREFKFYHSPRVWNGLPIMAANMFATGSIEMARTFSINRAVGCLHKYHKPEDLQYFLPNLYEHIWVSVGIKSKDVEFLHEVSKISITDKSFQPNICIDVANGYTDDFVSFCSDIRASYSESIIMAGNVCTPEQVQELILHGGVDIVKVGIGPGSACTTRLVTGVGYPQLSAVVECAHAAHGLKSDDRRLGLICADGGCRTPGDICKALCANADFVMLGGMLAGCDECDGEWTYKKPLEYLSKEAYEFCGGTDPNYTPILPEELATQRKHSLRFYGMSSHTAQEKHGGGKNGYRASEGREIEIPHKGPVKDVMQEIVGGIRSCCAYIGAKNVKDMAKCARFVRVNRPHNNMEL